MNHMFSRSCNFETLRNKIEFKHVRFKTSIELKKKNSKLSRETVKHCSEILSTLLNCNIHTASEIIKKNKEIEGYSYQNLCINAKFCKNYLKFSDLVEYPSLLTLQPGLLQHRYFSLKELGFNNIKPSYIFRFPFILKNTPQGLKSKGYPLICDYKSQILSEYLNITERTEVKNKLHDMYNSDSIFQKIKELMNAEFLAAKLRCSIGTSQMMLHRNAALRVQSIYNTDQLLNLLLYKFELSFDKIFNSLSILSVHPETAESFITNVPEVLGVDTVFLVKRLPLLLKLEDDTVSEIEAVLKDFNISSDQLINCPKVLSFTPGTLQKRLTALFSTPDFAVLKSSKRFLWLVYYYNSLNSRLQSLKNENVACSVNMFTVPENTFKKYLLYHDSRRGVKETYSHLAEVFKMSEKEISHRLQHSSHSQNEDLSCSILNCQKVIEFLLISGVTKKQIFNGLEIVYFDIEAVKHHFNSLRNHPLCQPYEEWISHYNFIQLLVYIIQLSHKNCSYSNENYDQREEYREISSNYC